MKKFLLLLGVILVICSTSAANAYTVSEKVIMRANNLEERPVWVSETMPVVEANGVMSFVGMAEVPIDSRVRAAFRASDAQAKAELAALIETNLTRIVSVTESGMGLDDVAVTSFVQECSRLSMNNIQMKDRYWEKVLQKQDTGDETGVMKLFSLIEMPVSEIKKQVQRAIKNSGAPSAFKTQMEVLVVQEWRDVD